MQQRVALARALAIEPRLLLLDEPLSALDAKVRVQLREEIRRIQTRLGITTIYVTHDQEEALSISDRVAVLSHGQIEQIGTPGEIYGAPATPFVAEFVGTMNRVESTVSDPESGQVEYDGATLAVDAARGRPRGERVLLLVRPEVVEVEATGTAENGLAGEVVSQTFLGSVTRLRVLAGPNEWTADLSAERAAALPVGAKVSLRFPSATAKLLSLEGESEPEGDPES
jgi:putative spermidine/putrescine transport system ATP-binding protein